MAKETSLEESIKKIVSGKSAFLIHLVVYLLFSAFFIVINLLFTPDTLWFIYPLILWGVAVLFHYWALLTETKGKTKSIVWILASNLVAFGIFLILLGSLNVLVKFVDDAVFHQVVELLNDNIGLILTLFIIFLIGNIFGSLFFPFNLPTPLINAVGSMFLITFIFRVFELIDSLIDENFFQSIEEFSFLIYPVVFIIVIVGGYITIFNQVITEERRKKKISAESIEKKLERETPSESEYIERESEEKTWEDVGNEFKEMLFDIFHNIRKSVNKEKKE